MNEWANWPFGPSLTAGWLGMLTKFVFIGFVLAMILGLLRFLFGPGGPMRDKELDEMAERRRIEREENLAVLKRRLAAGEISAEEYEELERILMR